MSFFSDFLTLLGPALRGKCPRCSKGNLFAGRFNPDLKERCGECGLDLTKNDSADGPAVFLIFIFGALLVPLALIVAYAVAWPLWVHGLLWGIALIAVTVGSLQPVKALVIALQYKFRPEDWQ